MSQKVLLDKVLRMNRPSPDEVHGEVFHFQEQLVQRPRNQMQPVQGTGTLSTGVRKGTGQLKPERKEGLKW